MIVFVRTEVRSNTEVPFWHSLPEVMAWCPNYEQTMINSGKMVSCVNEVSPDGLTFTRTAKFANLADKDFVIQNAPVQDYLAQRDKYAADNNIVVTKVTSNE